MPISFKIPKLSDRAIIQSLHQIRSSIRESVSLDFKVRPFQSPDIDLPTDNPDQHPEIGYALEAESLVIGVFSLLKSGLVALSVNRKYEDIMDVATIHDEWLNQYKNPQKTKIAVTLLSLAREKLNAPASEAALTGQGDSEWNRYRDAQTAVLSSLQQTSEAVLVNAAKHSTELDRKRTERFDKLEEQLRSANETERATFHEEIGKRKSDLDAREKALDEREASFETKESHYVARQKQGEQIEQIKAWLNDWRLTKGTSNKRWPIIAAYIVALIATGWLTFYWSKHSYDLLRSIDEIVKLAWWQWTAIWAKSFFPLAAFATFMIYFIRWSGDWARQHSEEEFRNRTRLIDIGRAAWLLEAVRDAQERNKELPPELLHELSRNLFATNSGPDSDIHPQAISDFMMQGLNSLRVKSADGTEVEASRGKRN